VNGISMNGMNSALARVDQIRGRIDSLAARGGAGPFAVHLADAVTETGGGLTVEPTQRSADMQGTAFDHLFDDATRRNDLPPGLLRAIAQVESGFRTDAVSPAGALGLMQFMPATARSIGVLDPFDPTQAIAGAGRLMKGHLNRFDGHLPSAIAAYHSGAGAVERHGGIPPFPQVQSYVPKVLTAMEGSR
jgi:peptidoglycan DL-endopeptidase CwlO